MSDHVRSCAWLAMLAAAMAFGPAIAASGGGATSDQADTLERRITACASCHGEHGRGARHGDTYYPRLANQSPAYLLKQLKDFRAGRRRNEAMETIVAGMPDAYLEEIARYYSRQDPPYSERAARTGDPEVDPALLERGHRIATHGRPEVNVPACTTCHGPQLSGKSEPGALLTPRIAGHYATYTSAQFEAWAAGTRRNDTAGMMEGVVERLSSTDRQALTAYLAATQPGEVEPAASAYIDARSRATSPNRPPARDPDLIERGRYLATAGDCAGCHTAAGGEPFAGNKSLETPYGTIYTPNITPDRKTGIGDWSAGTFYETLHTGISPDSGYLYPAFPFPAYTHITRDDTDAIYAYLMSLEPVYSVRQDNTFGWPFSMRSLMFGWRLLFFEPDTFEPDAQRSRQWNRGAYLVKGLGHCGSCHTPRNAMGARAGGQELAGAELPSGWYAPNITSSREHGIGDWGVDEIARLLKTGKARDRTHVVGDMKQVVHDSTQHLTMEDLRAIATYLKTVPAQAEEERAGEHTTDVAVETDATGKGIYTDHCADCHGEQGEGEWPAYPPLADNPTVSATSPINVIRVVSSGGFGVVTESDPHPHSMPPFAAHELAPSEIAEVVTYIRTIWGNQPGRITAEQVREAQ